MNKGTIAAAVLTPGFKRVWDRVTEMAERYAEKRLAEASTFATEGKDREAVAALTRSVAARDLLKKLKALPQAMLAEEKEKTDGRPDQRNRDPGYGGV